MMAAKDNLEPRYATIAPVLYDLLRKVDIIPEKDPYRKCKVTALRGVYEDLLALPEIKCHCNCDELNQKFAAVCKERDELKAKLNAMLKKEAPDETR